MGLGLYTQYSHADSITRVKLDSYSQIKEAGLWVKQNSDTGDVILSRSPHQITYYSERKTYSYGGMNETEFFNLINQVKPRYVIESALEPGLPSWMTPPSSDLEKVLLPIKAWYLDKEQKQIVLIVYQVDLTKTPNQQPVNNTDFIVNKTNSNLSSPNPLINKSNPF